MQYYWMESIMPNIGFSELLIILFIVVLLFGAKKLPDLARGLGQGIREFKKAARDVQNNDAAEKMEEPKAERKA
jgi:TatA/E family protein of Tat protein translocase